MKWKCVTILLLFWEAFLNVFLRDGEEFFELRLRWPFLRRWWNATSRFGFGLHRWLLLRWIHLLRIRNSKLTRETHLSPARTQCWVFPLISRMCDAYICISALLIHARQRVKELDFWTEEIIMITCTYDTMHSHTFNYLNSN